jgi:hypothetical protein
MGEFYRKGLGRDRSGRKTSGRGALSGVSSQLGFAVESHRLPAIDGGSVRSMSAYPPIAAV